MTSAEMAEQRARKTLSGSLLEGYYMTGVTFDVISIIARLNSVSDIHAFSCALCYTIITRKLHKEFEGYGSFNGLLMIGTQMPSSD